MARVTDEAQYPSTPEAQQAKAAANRAMFDAIAHRYDTLNRLMSLGLDARWRRAQVALCALAPGMTALDLCCGTGDVARALAAAGAAVTGLDASGNMLDVARGRGTGIDYVQGDALRTPFADDSFDAVTIAFGNRNVASLPALYAEMRRVAKPGGRIVSLEITGPTVPVLRQAFFLYFTHVPPLLARLLGADPGAYTYLPDSVRRYPDAATVAGIMRDAGLREVTIHPRMFGTVVLHRGIA
jgi:demethylmenaquinone methyltransferase/2-methoxy-6-polyprenyl-1,4-benzoquinol methylase